MTSTDAPTDYDQGLAALRVCLPRILQLLMMLLPMVLLLLMVVRDRCGCSGVQAMVRGSTSAWLARQAPTTCGLHPRPPPGSSFLRSPLSRCRCGQSLCDSHPGCHAWVPHVACP